MNKNFWRFIGFLIIVLLAMLATLIIDRARSEEIVPAPQTEVQVFDVEGLEITGKIGAYRMLAKDKSITINEMIEEIVEKTKKFSFKPKCIVRLAEGKDKEGKAWIYFGLAMECHKKVDAVTPAK
ncbi:MAG: hypothetical protein UT71_C0031G0010 [Parcubacteria group bacterium GW2011_GWF2_40_10]|nr:MAG: hypothetical protein UT71_C0031G0010 [Parcubacteria group bacterium GW2011_GWF2_40_10]HIG95027.1 hypothetical protein [Nanoarchaeota archaeon]HIH62862.1 hypothetical protein [Nanoarchaeota archaeon]HIJ10279.1 hypothetical protein [Nanoarchaeota archaeon]